MLTHREVLAAVCAAAGIDPAVVNPRPDSVLEGNYMCREPDRECPSDLPLYFWLNQAFDWRHSGGDSLWGKVWEILFQVNGGAGKPHLKVSDLEGGLPEGTLKRLRAIRVSKL
jgi:hypothetical protein